MAHIPRSTSIRTRLMVAMTAAGLTILPGCTFGGRQGPPEEAPTLQDMAASLGTDALEHLTRGYVAGRSPEIATIPEPWNVVVRWSGRTLGSDEQDPRSTHPTPWSYHQRVPLILYGPGYVTSGAVSDRKADMTDLASTFADLLGFAFEAEGSVLDEALLSRPRRQRPPRLVVLVAYDGGGWNLLQQWPDAWPVQRRLVARGAVYTNATIGSAPAVTAAIHANMGTGVYPSRHGLSENVARLPDGEIGEIFFDEADPRLLEAETLADAWDAEHDNRAWIGLLGYESWHLGMMGKGGLAEGGDRDVAVLWEPKERRFWINQEHYTLPGYLPGEDVLDRYVRELDALDGALDESWMGHDLTDPNVVPGTPAFVHYQGEAVLEMLRREPLGQDGVTDFLFVELKPTDFGGHIWNMLGSEEEAVLRAQDEVLGRLVAALDELVGKDGYVLALTADHGQTPTPETRGGVRIDPDVVGRRVVEYFRSPIVERTTPAGIFLDMGRLEEAGITLESVARYIATLRYEDVLPAGADPDVIPPQERARPVFAAALPGPFLEGLTEGQIERFGPPTGRCNRRRTC